MEFTVKPAGSKVIFTAMSKRNFYLREHIIKFVLESGFVPSSAFMMYSYFLLDTVDRQKLIDANNELIRRCDELWVFGEISDGVKKEIELGVALKMPVKYFDLTGDRCEFCEIKQAEARFEIN